MAQIIHPGSLGGGFEKNGLTFFPARFAYIRPYFAFLVENFTTDVETPVLQRRSR